jgi:hypothetical protein
VLVVRCWLILGMAAAGLAAYEVGALNRVLSALLRLGDGDPLCVLASYATTVTSPVAGNSHLPEDRQPRGARETSAVNLRGQARLHHRARR